MSETEGPEYTSGRAKPAPEYLPSCTCGEDYACTTALCQCRDLDCACPRAGWCHENDY